MEEVDKIIIHTISSLGCEVEEDIQSLQQFSTELIVESVARCIKTINSDAQVPSKLPPGMSARFRVGTSLADALRDLGYRGEIGYQTFLYSNETEIRKVFIFLVEKLPKATADVVEESLGAAALLQKGISAEIARQLSSPWTPPFLKPHNICWRGKPPKWHREGCSKTHNFHACPVTAPQGLGNLNRKIPKELKAYYSKDLPFVCQQTPMGHQLVPSLLEKNTSQLVIEHEWETEWNQAGLASRLSPQEYKSKKREKLLKKISEQIKQAVQKSEGSKSTTIRDLNQLLASFQERTSSGPKTKGSLFTQKEKLQFAKDEETTAAQIGIGEGPRADTEEEQQRKREQEIQDLKQKLLDIVSEREQLEKGIKKVTASRQQVEEQIYTQEKVNKDKEDAYRVKKRTLDLLPDAANNIQKLQSVVDASAQRLVSLANQWEKHRAPLIAQYREAKELTENQASEAEKKLEEIRQLREKMKEVAAQAKGKEELHKQLVAEYEGMTRDRNRSAYTRKIMEIVANIKRQKEEIDKILVDTRSVQKEINQLTGKLDRTFTVTDELIFRDAKKDEAVRKAYKYLAALHENCDLLIKTIEETGHIMRESRDLEDQIEQESNKKVLSNLEKISNDLKQMQKENAGLVSKLKKK